MIDRTVVSPDGAVAAALGGCVSPAGARRTRLLLLSTALVGAAFAPGALQAQSWNGNVDSNFANGANWSTGVAPTSTDVSTIASTPTTPVVAATTANAGQITMSGATIGINSGATLVLNTLTVGSGSTVTGAGAITTNTLFLDSGSVATDVALGILATMGGGTISGAISGAGQMLVSGGFNTLTGANSYSGGTQINTNASLTVGDSGTLGSITGDVVNSGTLTFTRSDTTAYGGVISGTGVVNKNGTGTLVLSGANTYSGATSILNGTLQTAANNVLSSASALTISAGATLDLGNTVQTVASLAGAGTISHGGGAILAFGGDNASTSFSGSFGSSSIHLKKEGTGTFSFSGTSALGTFSPVEVIGGTLAMVGTGSLAGAALRLHSGTALDISASTAGASFGYVTSDAGSAIHLGSKTLTIENSLGAVGSAINGVIDGSGGLTGGQNSSLRLFGVNTYSGPTTLSSASATLDLRHVSAIAASSEVNLAASGATLDISNAGGDATIQALRGVAGSIVTLRNSNLVITNAASDFAGIIKPAFGVPTGGVILNGGHQTLSGINTYLGATTVNAGTLSVNGSIASSSLTTVNASGTLGGSGTLGNTTINGGTLAPGNSIGLLTVQGNLVLTSASRYMVEVSPGNADRVDVTGTATLGGAAVNASFAPGSYVAKQYTIVNAAGGVIGTFGSQVNTNLPSTFRSGLSYDASNAYLDLTLNFTPPDTPPETPPGQPAPAYQPLNANQRAVGNALVGYFNRAGGIPLVFGALNSAGLTQASGEAATGSQQTTFDAMSQFMGVLTDSAIDGRGTNGHAAAVPFADESMNYAAQRRPSDALAAIYRKASPMAPVFQERWNVWAAGFGGSRNTDGSTVTGSNDTRSSIAGVAVGADYWLSPNTIAGFALAGGGTNFSVAGGGSGRSDLFQAGAFVRHTAGSAYLTAAAAYGWQDVATDRTVSVAGIDRLRANFSANAYSGRIEGGNRFVMPWLGGVGLTPYAAAQVTAFDLPSYAETGAGGATTFALAYGGKTVTATRSELGFRTDRIFAVNGALLTLRGRAAWAHDYTADRSATATFQSLPGASFVVNGAAQAHDAALTTASAELKWTNGWAVAATFEGEFSQVTRSYAGKGVVRHAW